MFARHVTTEVNKDKIEEAFEEFEEGIKKLRDLRNEIEKLDLDKKKREEMENMLTNPDNIEELEKFIVSMKEGPKLKELQADLASLNTKGFER